MFSNMTGVECFFYFKNVNKPTNKRMEIDCLQKTVTRQNAKVEHGNCSTTVVWQSCAIQYSMDRAGGVG